MRDCTRCHRPRPDELFYQDGREYRTCQRCRDNKRYNDDLRAARLLRVAETLPPQVCTFCDELRDAVHYLNLRTGRRYVQCDECRRKRLSWRRKAADGRRAQPRPADMDEVLGGYYDSLLLLRRPFGPGFADG